MGSQDGCHAMIEELLSFSEEVAEALAERRAVVALETTLIAHGFRPPEGVAGGLGSEGRTREGGARGPGGARRGLPAPPAVSAALAELARTQALVVCSGVKSLLDVAATAELLETLGVPVLGFRTDTLPLFYAPHRGPPAPRRAPP